MVLEAFERLSAQITELDVRIRDRAKELGPIALVDTRARQRPAPRPSRSTSGH